MTKKILLINDDESIRDILQMYLEMKNYDVYQAWNGIQGLETAHRVLPDLILLDVMMPGMNGYEVCKALKGDAKTKDIPVLFLSSLLQTSEKIKGLESGAVDFINDAADYAEILARIETHLKIKELTQQLQASNQELMLKQKILNEDLRAAAMIQQNLLPNPHTRIPHVDTSWSCVPCEFVGGDICSIHRLSETSTVFYILDVSGHGVSSAMVAVSITQYIQQLLHPNLSPSDILMALNRDYPYDKFNIFSTLFCMVFNHQTGKLTYSSAGHPPAVYLSLRSSFRLLSSQGALVGIDSRFYYENKEIALEEGDKIILYTDGVTESVNSKGKLYGEERFYHLLEKIKRESIKNIVQLVNQSVKEFSNWNAPRDDVSILGIEFRK